MGRNLGPLNIKDSYEGLVQISGSDILTDGSGSLISSLDIAVSTATSASHAVIADSALTATSASHAVNADSAISSSYATTASFAENASVGTLQEVTDAGNTTTNEVNVAELYVDNANPTDKRLHVYVTGNGIHYNFSGSTADDHMFEINQEDIIRFQTSSITAFKDIDATGLTITANQVDATTFNGDLNGTASVATAATVFGDATNAERPLVFVDDNPSTGVGQVEQLRGDTTKSITYNPSTNTLTVPNTETTASYATQALTASYAENATGGATEWEAGTAASSSVSVLNNTPSQIDSNAPHSLLYSSGSSITAGLGFNVNLGGQDNQLGGGGYGATIIGGLSNEITDNFIGSIIGGRRNDMQSYAGIIAGASDCTVDGGFHGFAIGTQDSEVVGNIDNCGILGGDSNTVSHARSVVIGGDTLSTSKADEVVVPDLTIKGQAIGDVNTLTITSNTASLDCSAGNMFTLTINQQSDVLLNASNVTAGQTINLSVRHDATNSGSLSFSGDFIFPGGTAPTITAAANSKDVLTFVSFDSTDLYGTSLLNFS